MVCRALTNYSGSDKKSPTFENWSGDVTFNPDLLRVPNDLLSLVEAVADATDKGQSLHVVGNHWAFEDCAKDDTVMVSLANLNKPLANVLDVKNKALTDAWIDKQNNVASPKVLVHVEAGIRLADLFDVLDPLGLAMPTLGGSNGQSLAGAISTSTHGGDWQQPPLPDLVRAVHLVTVGGRELWIEPASNPITRDADNNKALRDALPCDTTEVIRDDRLFDAVRVASGRFGVIYSFVLEVRRQFRVVEVVTTPTGASVLSALRAGQGTLSVFTPLFRMLNDEPIPADVFDAQGVPYFLQILFNSQRPSDVWVTRRWETMTDGHSDSEFKPQASKFELAADIIAVVNAALLEVAGVAGAVAGGTVVAVGSLFLGPIAGLIGSLWGSGLSVQILGMVAELDALLASDNPAFGALLAAALNAAWRVPGLGYLIPQIQGMVTEGQLRGGATPGVRRGLHHLVSTGVREDSDQTDFRSDSIEVIFDATTADYLAFLDEILPIAPNFEQAGYISLRPSLRSSALLSMHHVTGRRAIAIEIASVKNLAGNAAWMAYVHQAAIRHNGRPHWGQYNKLDALTVAMLYGESLNEWREALLAVSGTSTQFSNAFTRQRGLEPNGLVREVTSVKKKGGTITHVCNDGASWSPVAVADAIGQIQGGLASYVTRRGDYGALIKVVSDGHGGYYLRSQSDETSADNLDSLPLSMAP